MDHPKFFRYLQCFQRSDWRLFERFLRSELRDEHEAVALFKEIKKRRKKLESNNLNVTDLITGLVEKASRKRIQNLMSLLSSHVEQYWIWSDLREQKHRMEQLKLESLNKRSLYAESQKVYEQISTINTLSPWSGYYKLRAHYNMLFSNHPKRSDRAWVSDIFSNATRDNITWYTNISKWFLAEMYNMNLLSPGMNDEEINQIEGSLSDIILDDSFSKVIDEQLLLIKGRYQKEPLLMSELLLKGAYEEPLVQLIFYYRVREYWLLKARKGEQEGLDKLVEIITWSIEQEVLLVNNEITYVQYISDLNVLCALASRDHVSSFINRYIDHVTTDYREDARIISDMLLSFSFDDHDKVLRSYALNRCKRMALRLQAVGLFLRSSYELYGSDRYYFEYYLTNTKLMVKRNRKKLSHRQAEGWEHFLKIFGMMIRKRKKEMISAQMKQTDHLLYRQWVLAKLEAYPF